eukprot:scaffold84684_cov32-Tisochrysis_lutea.AAC.3
MTGTISRETGRERQRRNIKLGSRTPLSSLFSPPAPRPLPGPERLRLLLAALASRLVMCVPSPRVRRAPLRESKEVKGDGGGWWVSSKAVCERRKSLGGAGRARRREKGRGCCCWLPPAGGREGLDA